MGESRRDGESQERIGRVFEQQADATLSEPNPGTGTKYTVLDTTKRVRIISISVSVTWTVQPTPLEIHITIDGQTVTFTFTDPVTATDYIAFNIPNAAETAQGLKARAEANDLTAPPFLREGRTVKVEAETTGGTTSNLSARVKYAVVP